MYHSSLGPGPGTYNSCDNIIWNKMSNNGDKKGKQKEEKKDKDKDKKKNDKPTPGPGSYNTETYKTFKVLASKGGEKKKDKDEIKKKKDDEPKLFGQRMNKVPGPGHYNQNRELNSYEAKLTMGRYATETGLIRRNIFKGKV